ncbi:unnamed protein product [Owenia fusiformis]|uniref:Phosphatidylinositol-glycan biosynthesis class W protein n=1 Tax=Owenia fusiformis TaxID=6347 RepID=A0A8J1Y1T5_OWEFU|nr:unnamed protein product [Owenia fusiformis]
MADAALYKQLKEEFVSNCTGTSVGEIALVVTTAPIAVLLRDVASAWFGISQLSETFIGLKLLFDFSMLILPVQLCFTLLADHTTQILTTLLMFILGILIASRSITSYKTSKNGGTITNTLDILNKKLSAHRPFISGFRAYVNIATAISILAVDFRIYPRRFAKVETYGSGLMDVGVGAFVISNAIVSREAKGKHDQHSSVGSALSSLLRSIKSCSPLILLGLVRLLSVKSTDYQEHVSEYGVHWNFFFTLAVVKVLSTVVFTLFSPVWSGVLGILITCVYQYCLEFTGLRNIILHGSDGSDSREGFLNANREGISSCLGYLAIYCIGVQIGRHIFKPRERLKDWLWLLLEIVLLDLLSWGLYFVCDRHIEPISRRMANISFVIWMVSYNLQSLGSFLLADLIYQITIPDPTLTASGKNAGDVAIDEKHILDEQCLLTAINRNGLFYFLLANLLTGAVNFSIKTLFMADIPAFMVITAYMFLLSAVSVFLHTFNITVKFW